MDAVIKLTEGRSEKEITRIMLEMLKARISGILNCRRHMTLHNSTSPYSHGN